jgi:hypothetical protein
VDPLDVLAEQVEVDAHRLLAVPAVLAGATVDAGRHRHVIARLEPLDCVAHLADDPRRVRPGDVGHLQVQPRQPAPRPHVEVVQRRRLHVDEHLVAARLRLRVVAVLDHVRVAVSRELDGLHTRWVDGRDQNGD